MHGTYVTHDTCILSVHERQRVSMTSLVSGAVRWPPPSPGGLSIHTRVGIQPTEVPQRHPVPPVKLRDSAGDNVVRLCRWAGISLEPVQPSCEHDLAANPAFDTRWLRTARAAALAELRCPLPHAPTVDTLFAAMPAVMPPSGQVTSADSNASSGALSRAPPAARQPSDRSIANGRLLRLVRAIAPQSRASTYVQHMQLPPGPSVQLAGSASGPS